MNANEFTFGIEIETIAPNSAVQNDGLRIGPYKRGIQVPYLPTGWKAEADGSIDNSAGGHKCEIVSPVLRGAEGLAQVLAVVQTLEAKGHRVNVSCGVHVHVGWDRTWTADALARSHGLVRTDRPEEADVLLINTCSIREKAQEKVFSQLGR